MIKDMNMTATWLSHKLPQAVLNLLQYCSVLCFGFLAVRHVGS